MSVLNSIPGPIVQMGHVEKIVEHQQNHPQVQQQLAQEEAALQIARDRSKVDSNEPSGQGRKVKDKAQEEKEKKQKRQASGNKEQSPEDENALIAEEGASGMPKAENPWAGHIVNVKI